MSIEDVILACDVLIDFHAAFKERGVCSQAMLEAFRIELKEIWLQIKKEYNEFVHDALADEELRTSLVSVKAKYKQASSVYIEFLSGILEASRLYESKVKPSEERDKVDTDDSKQLYMHNIQVPPCETEVFSGNFLKWPAFRDMFTALYIKHSKLSPVQKLFHLRARTRDEALKIVSKFEIVDENFDAAWLALKNHYENKRVIVNSHLKILFDQPIIATESASALRELQSNINDALVALGSYDIEVSKWDAFITYLAATRLPSQTLALWEQSLGMPTELQTWDSMNSFLSNRYRVLESVADMHQGNVKALASKSKQASTRVHTHHVQVNSQCKLCHGAHALRLCPDFLKMTVSQRRNTVRKFKHCFNCLAYTHIVSKCKSNSTCFHCKGKHHSLLHYENAMASESIAPNIQSTTSSTPINSQSFFQSIPNVERSSSDKSNAYTQSFITKSKSTTLLATARVIIHQNREDFEWRALIDPGSEISFISEEVQRRLRLPTRPVRATVSGVNTTVTATSTKMCSFNLRSKSDPHFSIFTQALVLTKVADNLPSISLEVGDSQIDFPLADPFFHKCAKIDLLLGADLYPYIIRDGLKPSVLTNIVAQNTVFGWVLLGPLGNSNNPNSPPFSTSLSFYNEVSLNEEIQRFWQLEELPQTSMLTEDEQHCETLYEESTYRDATGRYVVRLPFKEDFFKTQSLGNSEDIAKKRFLRNEKRLLNEPEFKKEYDSVLAEYVDLGHMKPVNSLLNASSASQYFMPHHVVVKPESLTTKVRVVFNASSASSNGKSLNDVLHPGPALQTDITRLILNWRLYRYVFNSDIEKMYRQIKIHPDQTQFQKIFFRANPSDPLTVFEMLTLTFGVNCSPYLAIRTLQQLASEVKDSHPLASYILQQELFVDDVLSGAHELSTASKAQTELISVLRTAGFHLRKWTANAEELLRQLPKDSLLNEDFLRIDDKSSVKTLGIKWKATSDTFSFSVHESPQSSHNTKRSVLSVIARLYDPIGWLAPIVVTAKIIMQQIWKDKTDWDSDLLPTTEQDWMAFVSSLPKIASLHIPRWVEYTPDAVSQIHGFCDASEKAYAACIYLRIENNNKITSHLLWSKSKVAPVNTLSLPRLELQGAVLLAKMIQFISSSLAIQPKVPIKMWTDSTIVLAWLKKHPSCWKTFVANRTAEILKITSATDWSHVSSNDNPADLATRGVSPSDLQQTSLWWKGPQWLSLPESAWPHSEPEAFDEAHLEVKPLKTFATQVTEIDHDFENDLSRFSKWHRAICALAYILRYCKAILKRGEIKQSSGLELSHEQILVAKKRFTILTQQKYFHAEYRALKQGQPVSSKSWLGKFNPFIDDQGIIRAKGRLTSSTLSFKEQFPILLPHNSLFIQLYVQYVHELSLHGQIQLMMRMIRAEYWVPRLKVLIKKCIFKCTTCTRYKKQVSAQIMGALPPERTFLSRPFTNVGIDYAGPFLLKTYYGRKCRLDKGYVSIFVCFATRAIHLELVSDLTTQACLAAFTRFVSRRGTPENVFSDHGTNFVGASKVLLQDFHKALSQGQTADAHKFSQVKWHFIPPGSPHMGGLWEAGVKSFKQHFRKLAGNEKFTFEEFATLLARIESCLNSRPLSPMSEDIADIVPITPGHFLTGDLLTGFPEPSYKEQSMSIMNRWRKLQFLHHHFAARWKEEYLKELHKRYKWKNPQRNIQINDLVIIKNENLPPNEWRLGRIIRVHPGQDNQIRVADVKTEKGVITRSIAKLCVLLPQE